ncbi:hypothetical protein [Streptomyces griseus]|uniref:hypothetical protein n=1 Tax=Streptomyces griseus TaxID=1911 RepID=UPI001586EB14|nr:hypothetical protein [Streptomyces griseus]
MPVRPALMATQCPAYGASARESEAISRVGSRVREEWGMAERLARTTFPYGYGP